MLDNRDRDLLAFEAAWTRDAGVKHQEIRKQTGLSAARYYMVVNRILDDPDALEVDPQAIARLRSLRAACLEKRAQRHF